MKSRLRTSVVIGLAVSLVAIYSSAVAQSSDAQPATNDTGPASGGASPSAPSDSASPPPSQAASDPPTEPMPAGHKPGADSGSTEQPLLNTIPVPQREEPLPPPPVQDAEVLETVIVTAQRRAEDAQTVPISITVFDEKKLADANITSASDLATYTPSLSTNQRFGTDNATFAIRGFVQDLRTTASVGVYFAEVIAPRGQNVQASGDGAGPGEFFDLSNVQVLKGPQGTLFGRNTTGGAILIVPKKPVDMFEAYSELSGGDFSARRAQAVINIPVTSWFKFRLGIDRNQREGHLINFTEIGAKNFGNTNFTAARLSSVLNLGDSIENYTIFSYVDSNSHGYTSKLFACNPDPNPANNPFYLLTGQQCAQQLQRQADAGKDGYYDIVSTIATPVTAINTKRIINTTTWQATDDVSIKNIVAYAHLVTDNGSDIFGTQFHAPYDLDQSRELKIGITVKSPGLHVTDQDSWVEELQFQGQLLDDRLHWQFGGYYERSMPSGYSGNNGSALISCNMASLEKDPSQFNCFDVSDGLLGNTLVGKVKTNYYTKAAYVQTTFDLSKQVSVTGGLRYTWDKTEGESFRTFYPFIGTVQQPPRVSISNPHVESQAPTGLFEVSYTPIDGVMGYAKYVRGYRQGSVNLGTDIGIDTFKPEHVNTYEVGAKTSFSGLVPGRVNFALFYNDFTDQQLQAGYVSPTSGPSVAIFNAGKSRITGAEVETYFRFFNSLTLSLSASFLDTKLIEQADHKPDVQAAGGPIAGLTYTPSAVTGDTLPFAPRQTYVAFLDYTLPFPRRLGLIDIGATYVFTGKQRAAASTSSPWAVLDSYSLLNFNLNWRAILNSPLDLSAFATNVLDREYMTYVSGTYNTLGFESRMAGMPRMFGARLRYNFGAAAP